MTLLDKIMAWEEGSLSDDDTVSLFQELVNNGMAWSLQGMYGREAMALIRAGLVRLDPHDYRGYISRKPIPAKYVASVSEVL